MLKKYIFSLLPVCCLGLLLSFYPADPSPAAKPLGKLSEYGFFEGNIVDQKPIDGIVPYDLNTPLFSDYAEKLRFVQVPEGTAATYHDKQVFDFPKGTNLIKTFYYPHDARHPEQGRRLIETRVLTHTDEGWKAWTYMWNKEQTEAFLEVAGEDTEVQFTDSNGKKRTFSYSIPNVNQCKGCHSYEGKLLPIGPTARQLNHDYVYAGEASNQIAHWQGQGILEEVPTAHEDIPTIPIWDDPSTGDVNARARAWLDINCAHCHNPKGPASTSGFFLDIHQTDPHVMGVYKAPVSAGRGTGNRKYDIHPGKPDKSILYFRINSDDPGVMMPEVGHRLIHEEGVALIREWIKGME